MAEMLCSGVGMVTAWEEPCPRPSSPYLLRPNTNTLPLSVQAGVGGGGGVIIVCYTCTVGVEREANSLWTRLANMAIV